MRIGAKVPSSGPLALERGVASMAAELESAGFESLWVSDHVVMPATIGSRYPFAADGRATWPTDTPYLDAVVALAVIATATSRPVLGTAVLVLPQRHPVILAKQAASLDVLSGGRLALGVGSGWLAEEFKALAAPFEQRGGRFVEWVELLRSCWTGEPEEHDGAHYRLPAGVICRPTPAHHIPLLVGGVSTVALRRAGALGDGWLAQQSAAGLDLPALRAGVELVRRSREESGRDGPPLWTALRIVDSASRIEAVAEALAPLSEAGVDEVIVDIDWSSPRAAADAEGLLHEGATR